MELSFDQWKEVKDHCEAVNLHFLSSPFSCAGVDLLEDLDIQQYKVGSGEITNHLLLDKIAATGKPVILSSGLSNIQELDDAVEIFKNSNSPLALMQCTTAYPTLPSEWGLDIINFYKSRYNINVGFSDHSGNIYACLAATALGASLVEFHVVFDKRMFGPDAVASIEIDEAKRLVEGVRQIRTSLATPLCKNTKAESLIDLKQMFGKSLAVNKDLPKGHIIQKEDLEAKKPSQYGIAAADYKSLIGTQLSCSMKKWDFLTTTTSNSYE
jgi:N-acetylneuraminate synthase